MDISVGRERPALGVTSVEWLDELYGEERA
jgi:hypothetical protein